MGGITFFSQLSTKTEQRKTPICSSGCYLFLKFMKSVRIKKRQRRNFGRTNKSCGKVLLQFFIFFITLQSIKSFAFQPKVSTINKCAIFPFDFHRAMLDIHSSVTFIDSKHKLMSAKSTLMLLIQCWRTDVTICTMPLTSSSSETMGRTSGLQISMESSL